MKNVGWDTRQEGGITNTVSQRSTEDLVKFLDNADKFIRSENEPKTGDIFLWREKKHGHTGIVESVDKDGTVHTIEAYSTKMGTRRFTWKKGTDGKIKELDGHEGWKDYYRPKVETPDGKSDKSTNGNDKNSGQTEDTSGSDLLYQLDKMDADVKEQMKELDKSIREANEFLKDHPINK